MPQKTRTEPYEPEPVSDGVRKPVIDEASIVSRFEKIENKYRRRLKNDEKDPLAPPTDRNLIKRYKNKIININNDEKEDKTMIFFDKSNVVYYDKETDSGNASGDRTDERPDFVEDPGNDEVAPGKNSKRNTAIKEIIDWAKHIIIAVALGLILVLFVVQRNEVIGSSMEPNLYGSDQLLVQKISKLIPGGIAHNDIITVNAEGLLGHTGDKNIIKRTIGIPGDTIEIKDDAVFRNGEKLVEPYLHDVKTVEREPKYSHVTLGDDEYYVLGDNRTVSLDSRTFGPINKSRIIGEVLIRFYPLKTFGKP
ncbi:MAG: signal peptidase I [Saccharofermentanales bacterium]